LDQAIEQVHVPPWAWVLVGLAVFAVYLMSQENGVLMKSAAGTLHEFFHDGRHFLGVPCH
jgi:hypothetical protein